MTNNRHRNPALFCCVGLGVLLTIFVLLTLHTQTVRALHGYQLGNQPDLVIESVQLSNANPAPNEPIDITITVRNMGSQIITRGAYVYLYVDPASPPPTTNSVRYDQTFVPSLAVGGTFIWRQLGMSFGAGSHSLYAWVDPTERIAESDETNNLRSVAFTAGTGGPSQPDLFESDDTCETARAIGVNDGAQLHTIHTIGDIDVVRFAGRAGITYTISITNEGSTADTSAELFNGCPFPLAGGSRDYTYVPLIDETVWVRMTHRTSGQGTNTGYQVQVRTSAAQSPAQPAVEWTALIFINGDNNLAPHAARARNELESAIRGMSNTHVLLLYDGNNTNAGDTLRYDIQPGGLYTEGVNRWYQGELNMGDGTVLSNFLDWGMTNYPARHYYVAIADHGMGMTGISFDDSSPITDTVSGRRYSDRITPSEMRLALSAATQNGARRIDVLHYDGCLMAMLENAWQVHEYARYLVSSQNEGWSLFGYADYLSHFTADPRASAIALAQRYHDRLTQDNGYPLTLSVLDLDKLQPTLTALNQLAEVLSNTTSGQSQTLIDTRNASQLFDSNGSYSIESSDDYVDLLDFARNAATRLPAVQTAAQALAATLTDPAQTPIVFNTSTSGNFNYGGEHRYDLERATGISIYYPSTRASKAEYVTYQRNGEVQMNAVTKWDDVLEKLLGPAPLPPNEPLQETVPISLIPIRPVLFLPAVSK